tara:strand:- start:3629 stop:4603 length:975 start_codon:yes stop_codon:yes gene_type:complete
MKILVTGGAGYIGSHVVFELIDQGHDVTIFDDMSLGSEKNIDSRANFVKGSTMAESDLDSVCQDRFDCVLHFAAWKAAGESMINPGKYAKNNLNGTINLINACDKYDIEYFVFSSSAAVYGMPEYLPLDEMHPLNPGNYYGATKLMVEKNLEWFSELKGMKYASLRYFNAAGYDVQGRIIGLEKNPQNLIPITMEVACGIKDDMKVFGNDYSTEDGTGVRDYIHVNDLAVAHVNALDYLVNNNKDLLVNLGTGKGHSVLSVIEKTEEITGKAVKFEVVGRRNGDVDTIISISELANDLINWTPIHSDLDTLIRSTWQVYKEYVR